MNNRFELHIDRLTIRQPRSTTHEDAHMRNALVAALSTRMAEVPSPSRISRAALDAAAAAAADEIMDTVKRASR